MPIEISGQPTPGQTAMGQAFQTAQQQQPKATPPGHSPMNPFGFNGISMSTGILANAPIRNAMGSEQYLKLSEMLKEMAKGHNRQAALDIRVLELDRNVNPNLNFAGFIVAVQSKNRPDLGVGYNVMIMESTGTPLPDRIETNNNEQVVIPVYTEDVDNDIFKRTISDMLMSAYGENIRQYRSDTAVIPADFDYEDTSAVEALIANASAAATSSLVMFSNGGEFFSDLNLVAEMRQRPQGERGDADLTFVYNFSAQRAVDYLKLPTRASVVIQAMTGYRRNSRTVEYNSGKGPRVVTEATGFVELMPVLPRYNMQPNYNGVYIPGMSPTQRLAPVLVINSMKTDFAYSPGAMLLDILTAADLNRGFGWVAAFHNKIGSSKAGQVDLTDVTAITVDMPSMQDPTQREERPVVGAGGMTVDQLLKFLGTYCQPNLYVANDVPWASHNTWYLSLFSEAATGNQGAVSVINEAMNTLTDGKFSSILPQGTKMFANTPMVIERGFWEQNGERRDIADIDFVAVCNYADMTGNMTLPEKWTNTFLRTDLPTNQRLAQRREIIQEITGRTATFLGKAVRVFWNGPWLAAGLQALNNAGVTTASDGRGTYGFTSGRAHADFLNNAALPSEATWGSSMGTPGGNFGNFNSMWSQNVL